MNVCCQSFSLTCLLVLTFAFSRSSPFIIFLFKFVGNCKEPFLDHVKTSQTLTHANINFNLIFSHEIRMRIRFVLLIWLTNILKGKIFHFCFLFTQKLVFFCNLTSRKHSEVLVLCVEHGATSEMITTMIRMEM